MQTHNRLHTWTNQQEKFQHPEIKTGVHTQKCSYQRDDAMRVCTGKWGNRPKMLVVTHCVQVGEEALGLTLANSCIDLGSEKNWIVNCGSHSHKKLGLQICTLKYINVRVGTVCMDWKAWQKCAWMQLTENNAALRAFPPASCLVHRNGNSYQLRGVKLEVPICSTVLLHSRGNVATIRVVCVK